MLSAEEQTFMGTSGEGGNEPDVTQEIIVMKREAALLPLSTLLSMRWQDNPKLHQDALIQFSVDQYGFNDPLGVCLEHGVICTGHGRLGVLSKMYDAQLPAPRNIEMDESGMWLVPCELLTFASRADALRYALLHNRSGTSKLDGADYDQARLNRALRAAASGSDQFALPGFTDGDIGTAFTQSIADMPPLPVFDGQLIAPSIFDASKLPDAPGYQADQVTQTYVIMVTAPSYELMLRMLRAITYGQRSGLPESARFCSVEGMRFIEQWETRNLSSEQRSDFAARDHEHSAIPAEVLPGQLTLAGDIVTDKAAFQHIEMIPGLVPDVTPVVPGLEDAWKDLMASASSTALSPTARDAMDPESLFEPALQTQPNEPKWKSGLCPTCGGSGHTGYKSFPGKPRQRVICVECGGAGDRDTWLSSQATQDEPA